MGQGPRRCKEKGREKWVRRRGKKGEGAT